MKKSVLALAMAFGVTGAFAQDLTSKKGEPYLPEAGDWSIGIDATPFLNYAGQFFSNAGASAPTWEFLNTNNTIIGKMFADEKTAYRGIIRLGMNSRSWTNEIATPQASTSTGASFPARSAVSEDELKSTTSFIGLGGGIEMRRGKTRLQGYYGGDAMFWMSGAKDKFTYGNALSQGAADPNNDPNDNTVSTDWNASGQIAYNNLVAGSDPAFATYPNVNGARITEIKNRAGSGAVIGFGVRGFIGAEYFVLPKLSIGAEFGWGVAIVANRKTTTTYEAEGVANGATQESAATIETEVKNGKRFTIDTDRNMFGTGTGSLRLNLHF